MNLLAELRRRFATALEPLCEDPHPLLEMIRRSQDPKFGDYQANCAMPLGKQLSRPPRDVAAEIVAALKIDDLCEPAEVAGPGFINLRLRQDLLLKELQAAVTDERLGVKPVAQPRTYIVDYSAPNVAKPMHVGHIRSTVIGGALYRTLSFLGHKAIGDNHIGDWGTQFGMIIYGYKNFLDAQAYAKDAVDELARLYKLVNTLVEYHQNKARLPELKAEVAQQQQAAQAAADAAATKEGKDKKKADKEAKRQAARAGESQGELKSLEEKIAKLENDPQRSTLAAQRPDIGQAVLTETAKLHEGDAENLTLWKEFMPACLARLDQMYARMGVTFDETLGESFYHDRLSAVVEDLQGRGIAQESDGAVCIFFEESDVPMIIRKKDGAFLYATSDLATIQYRMERWRPDAMLYVVDHRQSLHFEQLFEAARRWGCADVELQHINFGTVLGEDKRPFKTRSGAAIGLGEVLNDSVAHALKVVSENDDAKPGGPELSPQQRQQVAEVVGIGAIKYADLSHNRTSDYVFSYEKMMSTTGNTATYMQYAYARVRSIFRRGEVDIDALRNSGAAIQLDHASERALAVEILRFAEALDDVVADYRPNQLTSYLFDQLAKRFSSLFENCPVLQAETEELRNSRLLLCDLTARVLKQGLALLGIDVVEQM